MYSQRRHVYRFLNGALLAIVLFAGCESAQAYNYLSCVGIPVKWAAGGTRIYVDKTIPAGSAWEEGIRTAIRSWNTVSGSKFVFSFGRRTDGKHSYGNGVSEIYRERINDDDVLATTFRRYSCGWIPTLTHFIETDIRFNDTFVWSTGPFNHRNSPWDPYNVEGVALHELGHALGLAHEENKLAMMNPVYPAGGPFGYYKQWDPWADDRRGARGLYPDGTTETDVAASPRRLESCDTCLGIVLNPTRAERGSWVEIEFTFSNLSTSTETFDIEFYLSMNDYITTGDTYLGKNFGAWGTAGFSGTFRKRLWIPTWVTPGLYYLGFVLDPGNTKGETNENNNSQALPFKILII